MDSGEKQSCTDMQPTAVVVCLRNPPKAADSVVKKSSFWRKCWFRFTRWGKLRWEPATGWFDSFFAPIPRSMWFAHQDRRGVSYGIALPRHIARHLLGPIARSQAPSPWRDGRESKIDKKKPHFLLVRNSWFTLMGCRYSNQYAHPSKKRHIYDTMLVLFLYLQSYLNIKSVWGDWLFSIFVANIGFILFITEFLSNFLSAKTFSKWLSAFEKREYSLTFYIFFPISH